ncbi:MAG: hypothetical protein K2G03_03895, partial [Bacilli bacterium]|nr:hypothetical protein [Bacilli bacterium]
LNMANSARKATPLKNDSTTETTEKIDEPIITTNFSSSLLDIVGNNRFLDNYKEEVNYSGAIFNFNCTSYDEEKKVCNEGSGLMNTGSALIPLFTYKNEEDNYLKRADDYYIIVNDEFIILVMNEVGVKKGVAKVMNRQGKFMYEIENVITGYKEGKELYKGLYPSIKDNVITYYACESKSVKVLSLDLNKPEEIEYLDDIEKVSCS